MSALQLNKIGRLISICIVMALAACSHDEDTSVDELGLTGTVWVYEDTLSVEQEKCTLKFNSQNVSVATIKAMALGGATGAIVSTSSRTAIYRSYTEQGTQYVSFDSEKYKINGSSMKLIGGTKEFVKQ